ncbi:MAG: hypothetical protein AB7T37_00725 [Dehalococcoidia bacterium]
MPAGREETSFRGAGHRITAVIQPSEAIFGGLPGEPVEATGDTTRAPDSRLSFDQPRFPPDDLRALPFWDYARREGTSPVVVLAGNDGPVVRPLHADDDLPEAVGTIHRWLGLPPAKREEVIPGELRKGASGSVAWVAGFQILADDGGDLPALIADLLGSPGIPAAAAAGIVDDLSGRTLGLANVERAAVASALWEQANETPDGQAMGAILRWFDANWRNVPASNRPSAHAVLEQCERAKSLAPSGPAGDALREQLRSDAAALEATALLGQSTSD